MKSPQFLSFLLLFAANTATFAQDASPAKEPPPDPPLMTSAPADCQWTITYTPKVPEKAPVTPEDVGMLKMRLQYSPVVVSKNVMKSAGQVVVLTTYEAGLKSEAWVVGGYLYELPMRAGAGIKVNSRGQGDFPDIYGVTADNFRGTVDLKGTKAHLYEMDGADAHPGPTPASPSRRDVSTASEAKPGHQRVYIDAKTRLPLMVDAGRDILTYKYAGPPANFPTPNDRIAQLLRESAQSKKR